MFKITMN